MAILQYLQQRSPHVPSRRGANVEAPLAILLWTTLAAAAIGLATTVVVAVRRDGRVSMLLLPFAAVAVLQVVAMPELRGLPLGLDLPTLQAVCMLVAVVGSFAALLAMARVARERNAAEELHWDAMESLHAVNELALPELPRDRIGDLLEIGARHFGMTYGVVLPQGSSTPVALHPTGIEEPSQELVDALQRHAHRGSERPLVDDAPDPELHPDLPLERIFLTGLYRGEHPLGLLAFASLHPEGRTLTATDKDLMSLLAHHVGLAIASPAGASVELDSVEPLAKPMTSVEESPAPVSLPRPLPPAPLPPAPVMAPDPPQVPSLGDRVRASIGDDTIPLAVAPDFERAGSPTLPPEDVMRDLVAEARALSQAGALEVEAGSTRSPQGNASFLTLTVHVKDRELDARRIDASLRDGEQDTPLASRLRERGGDVSISLETGVGASLTAYLPLEPRRAETPKPSLVPRYAT